MASNKREEAEKNAKKIASRSDDTSSEKKKKKPSTASVREDGSYDVVGDRAERQGIKDTVTKARKEKTKERKGHIIDDSDIDENDGEATFKDKLKDVSWGDVFRVGGLIFIPLALLFTIVSFMIGRATAPHEEAKEPDTVSSIEGVHGILDDVETLKDHQIIALRKQLGSINDDTGNSISADEFNGLSKLNSDIAGVVDPFFNAVIGLDRNAGNAEIDNAQKQVSDMVTGRASTSELYSFLHGPSPMNQLNTNVTKSGPVEASWIGSGKDAYRTFMVIVPIVNEQGNFKAMYTVSLDGKDKIDKVDYNGLIFDSSQPVERSLSEQLNGDPEHAGDTLDDRRSKARDSNSRSGSHKSSSSGSDSHMNEDPNSSGAYDPSGGENTPPEEGDTGSQESNDHLGGDLDPLEDEDSNPGEDERSPAQQRMDVLENDGSGIPVL